MVSSQACAGQGCGMMGAKIATQLLARASACRPVPRNTPNMGSERNGIFKERKTQACLLKMNIYGENKRVNMPGLFYEIGTLDGCIRS